MKGKTGPQILTVIIAAIILGDYFLKIPALDGIAKDLSVWAVIVWAFALAFAAVNLTALHAKKIATKPESRINSIVLLVGMFGMAGSGLFLGRDSTQFSFFFDTLMIPIGSAVFSLLVFYIASAAFRVFRARNLDGAILLISAIVLLMGRAPASVGISRNIPKIADWIMDVPNIAGQRAFLISAAVGSMATSVRVLLGIERRYGS